MSNSVKISQELLDHLVDALTYLPYRQVQDVFAMLGDELSDQEKASQEQPQLIVRK